MRRALELGSLVMALLGCTPDSDGGVRHGTQIGDEGNSEWGCVEVGREVVEDPAAHLEGFGDSPDGMWARAGGAFAGPLTLEAGGELELRITLDEGGPWELVRQEEPEPAEGEDVANIFLNCADYYVRTVPATLEATPELDEELDAEVRLLSDGQATLAASIPAVSLVGTAAPEGFDLDGVDDAALVLSANMAQAALPWTGSAGDEEPTWRGELLFSGSQQGTGGDPSVAFIEPYGSFELLAE